MNTNTTRQSHTRKVFKAFTVGCVCSAIALTAGCGKTLSFNKDDTHKPTKLVKIERPINVVQPVFSTSLSGRFKQGMANRFELGFNGKQVIAASTAGKVDSYNMAGEKLWTLDLNEDIVGGVSFDTASETAIVTTKSARVIAIDAIEGTIRWQTKLAGTVLAPALINNNRVVLSGNDGMIRGLSLQTGESVWQFSTKTPSISIRGSAKPVLLDYNVAVIASADGRLHAVDIDTGIPKWSRRVGVPSGGSEIKRMTDIDGTPAIDGRQLFAVSYSGQLIGFDLNTGQALFVEEVSSNNSLAVIGDAVISTTLDGIVKATNRQTGELLWESKSLAYRQLSNPVVVGSYVAIGDLDGEVHFLSPVDGSIVSRTKTKGAVSLLQSKAGYLLTQTQSGQVSAWRLDK